MTDNEQLSNTNSTTNQSNSSDSTDLSANQVINENALDVDSTKTQEPKSIDDKVLKNKVSELVQNFLLELPNFFSELQLKKQFRRLADGLYIGEELLPEFLKHFALWQARKNNTSATVDIKITEKIFGERYPQPYYLLDGKLCQVGFLIPSNTSDLHKKIIPEFRGSLTSTLDTLHPRDPGLVNIPNTEVVLDRTGFGIKLKVRQKTIFLNTTAIKNFQQTLSNSPRLRRRYPAALQGLRSAITPLERLLISAKPVRSKQTVLIPSALRSQRNLIYLRNGGFFFVLSDNYDLITAYELRGRNFRNFIFSELDLLRSSRSRHIGIMEIYKKRGAIVGALRTNDGEFNLLHIDALFKGLEMILRRRALRKKLNDRITLYDCIKLISKLFSETIRIEAREVPYQLIRHYSSLLEERDTRNPRGYRATTKRDSKNYHKNKRSNSQIESLRYRAGSGWVFFIHDHKVVKSMYEKPIIKAQTVTIINPLVGSSNAKD
jgi:hypothetical protein